MGGIIAGPIGQKILGGIGAAANTYGASQANQGGDSGTPLPQVVVPSPVQIPQMNPDVYRAPGAKRNPLYGSGGF